MEEKHDSALNVPVSAVRRTHTLLQTQHRTQILVFNVNFKDFICMLPQAESLRLNPSQASAYYSRIFIISYNRTEHNNRSRNTISYVNASQQS